MGVRFITLNSNERRYGFAYDWRFGDNHGLCQCASSACPRGHAIGQRSTPTDEGDRLRPEKISKLKAASTLAGVAAFSL